MWAPDTFFIQHHAGSFKARLYLFPQLRLNAKIAPEGLSLRALKDPPTHVNSFGINRKRVGGSFRARGPPGDASPCRSFCQNNLSWEVDVYVITNRNLLVSDFQPFSKEPKEVFGSKPNEEGPNEVRLFEAKRVNNKWRTALVPDIASSDEAKEIAWCDTNEPVYGSHLVAQRVVEQARTEKRNILLFVHGYNNDIHDVLDRAEHIEQLYGVIVVPFFMAGRWWRHWPCQLQERQTRRPSFYGRPRPGVVQGRGVSVSDKRYSHSRGEGKSRGGVPHKPRKAECPVLEVTEEELPFSGMPDAP